jgi:hypothetical protein
MAGKLDLTERVRYEVEFVKGTNLDVRHDLDAFFERRRAPEPRITGLGDELLGATVSVKNSQELGRLVAAFSSIKKVELGDIGIDEILRHRKVWQASEATL